MEISLSDRISQCMRLSYPLQPAVRGDLEREEIFGAELTVLGLIILQLVDVVKHKRVWRAGR